MVHPLWQILFLNFAVERSILIKANVHHEENKDENALKSDRGWNSHQSINHTSMSFHSLLLPYITLGCRSHD